MRHKFIAACPDYNVAVAISARQNAISTDLPHAILNAVNEVNGRSLALIFDLDGVLVHSMPLHTASWERYLEDLGIRIDDLERRMHGKRNSELVRDLIDGNLSEDVIFEHGAAKERLFRKMLLESDIGQYRVPGIVDFLQRHNDLPKAVGSNAELANIDFVLDRLNLRPFFSVIVNGMQVQRPKPFPDIYLNAAEQLQVAPENCIVFEDSPTGVEAARAAGMRIVGVETTPTDFQGVHLRIHDFLDPQLEPWLAAQHPK
ncbi:MAG TPA: HAD family phosphatase [Bryobacteraceae bacterium]|nr:HAD family phosphatase [Bryobacteraceae bacterium]